MRIWCDCATSGHAFRGVLTRSEQVTWLGPDDKENPKNWSYAMKWVVTTLVSLISFVTTFSSSSIAPALPQIASGFSQTFAQLVIFRLLAGIGGSAPNTVSVSYLILQAFDHERAIG